MFIETYKNSLKVACNFNCNYPPKIFKYLNGDVSKAGNEYQRVTTSSTINYYYILLSILRKGLIQLL